MGSEAKPAAFLDRDGVINADLGHVGRVEDLQILPRAVQGMRLLAESGFELVIVTNQAGIAKGMYTEQDYQHLTAYLLASLQRESVHVRAVYHCPHHPDGSVVSYSIACDCRKPAPGMLLRAAAEQSLDLGASVLIGDKMTDVLAARAAGVGIAVLVASGHSLPQDAAALADYVCDDLLAAAVWLRATAGT